MKGVIDQEALIEMFSSATAQQSEQLRQAVRQATLGALQGRELSLKNIKDVLGTVSKAASTGVAQSNLPQMDVENVLNSIVSGMDDALLNAVEANRLALQQFASQGVDLQEKNLKQALSELEKIEDALIEAVKKSAEVANAQLGATWAQVVDKLQAGGTTSGARASTTVEQFAEQMQTAVRDTRAASLKAAQALAESYGALVSGVLIGMSEALQQGGSTTSASAAKGKGRRG
jgi:hypothetical protein